MPPSRALVTGAAGQDGWYLTEHLASEGVEVFGLVRDPTRTDLHPAVRPLAGDVRDADSLRAAISAARPEEVYNLAALSSVAESWRHPAETIDVNGTGLVRLLAAVRDSGHEIRVVQAGSAEIFGTAPAPQDETTPVAPVTPYGVSKALAHHAVRTFRAAGLWVASAIMFNHESPRRPPQFVTRRITAHAAAVANGSREALRLGNLAARRDWGFAGDYVRGLVQLARHDRPDDLVFATGTSCPLEEFVRLAFDCVGIADWREHVVVDPALAYAGDVPDKRGDPTRARLELGWTPTVALPELVRMMVSAEPDI